jgi:hypothetical protein
MRVRMKSRWVSLLVAVGYLLAVGTAPLFHNHSIQGGDQCCHGHSLTHEDSTECHHDGQCSAPTGPKVPASCPTDDSNCSVCKFLAQKPAPTAEVVLANAGTLVQETVFPTPASVTVGVFSAWHSRAPPAFA